PVEVTLIEESLVAPRFPMLFQRRAGRALHDHLEPKRLSCGCGETRNERGNVIHEGVTVADEEHAQSWLVGGERLRQRRGRRAQIPPCDRAYRTHDESRKQDRSSHDRNAHVPIVAHGSVSRKAVIEKSRPAITSE